MFSQDPTGCLAPTPPPGTPGQRHSRECQRLRHNENEPAPNPTEGVRGNELLRKEVIQPHLPVRLPCYDFVPIASPTFDRSPPYGLGHGLRVLPTFVT